MAMCFGGESGWFDQLLKVSTLVTDQKRKRTYECGEGRNTRQDENSNKKVALGTRDVNRLSPGRMDRRTPKNRPMKRTEQDKNSTYEGSNEACDCEPLTL
jgi:hypothetical protein